MYLRTEREERDRITTISRNCSILDVWVPVVGVVMGSWKDIRGERFLPVGAISYLMIDGDTFALTDLLL